MTSLTNIYSKLFFLSRYFFFPQTSASAAGEPQSLATPPPGLDLLPTNTDGGSAENAQLLKPSRDSVPQKDAWSLAGKQWHVDVKRDISDPVNVVDASGDLKETVYDEEDVGDIVSDVSDTYNEDDSLMSARNDLLSAPTEFLDSLDVPVFPEYPSKRGGPYWVARGKKGIRDYIPFYWGSNQNILGKTAFSRSALTQLLPLRPSSALQSERSGTEASPRITSSGWESNQNFWGKRNNGPFWIARGKKGRDDDPPVPERKWYTGNRSWGSNPPYFGKRNTLPDARFPAKQLIAQTVDRRDGNGPFWLSRGKRSQILNEEFTPWMLEELSKGQSKNFWTARGKKEEEGGTRPFWISRGKKKEGKTVTRGAATKDVTNPFWVSRGKKNPRPFWVARGKKDKDSGIWDKEGKTDKPFWIARGKKGTIFSEKRDEMTDSPLKDGRCKKEKEDNYFLVARGKKEREDNPFWAVRGKKTVVNNPYWISRGKKGDADDILDNPFWVTQGGKVGDEKPFWVARGKKEEEVVNPFWVARGKRPTHDPAENGEGPFWVVRGRRDDDQKTQQGHSEQLLQFLDVVLADDRNETQRRKNDMTASSI